jgi:hypothetical protein
MNKLFVDVRLCGTMYTWRGPVEVDVVSTWEDAVETLVETGSFVSDCLFRTRVEKDVMELFAYADANLSSTSILFVELVLGYAGRYKDSRWGAKPLRRRC